MIRAIRYAALLAVCLLAVGTADAAVIKNVQTPEYVDLQPVEARFLLPRGVVRSTRFDGFESKERRIEVVAALLKAPYRDIADSISKSTLGARGVEVLSQTDVIINDRRGTLIKARQVDGKTTWGKWLLAIDNGGATLVVNGVFVSGDAKAAEDILAMMKSVIPFGDESSRGDSGVDPHPDVFIRPDEAASSDRP